MTKRVRYVMRRKNRRTLEVETVDVLAYKSPTTPGKIRAEFQTATWEVLDVYLKPRRRPVPAAAVKRETGGGWKVSAAGLTVAKKQFDLQLPVVIKQAGSVGGTYGTHRLRTASEAPNDVTLPRGTKLYHHIVVKGYLTAEVASQTLWHELKHAEQAERIMRSAQARTPDATPSKLKRIWINADIRSRKVPYKRRPCEIEARKAESFADTIALALPNRN